MALGLLGALLYTLWRKNKAASSAATVDPTVPDQTPPVIFQSYVYDTDIQTGAGTSTPPVAGRPGTPPPGYSGTPISVVPPTPVSNGPPTPVPHPNGQWVTVSKYTTANPPWNSTLWGIAAKLLGNGSKWGSIWAAPQNATLKSRRKDPKLIQPGDRVWVPAK
jgi:nucleoid-associated protein YgaU